MASPPARRLLEWFRSSARALPWRTPFPRDPYAVLVSEVMAQQTRIDRVVPAYRAFMRRFPTIHALARSGFEEVMHAFSGLGYYRRARLLHAAAAAVVGRGAWPATVPELRALPGFGPYTAAAVAAFAFAGDEPPVDGNVARVTARIHALPLAMGSALLLHRATETAAAFHADVRTPEVWEALMELGALVCAPAAPRCDACPLAPDCAALASGAPSAFPLPRPKRAREEQCWVAVWLVRQDGAVLLRRVDDGSLLRGLWVPPFAVVTDGVSTADAAHGLAREAGVRARLKPAAAVRHSITHRDIRIVPFVAALGMPRAAEPADGWSWQDPARPAVPTSSLVAKLAAACGAAASSRTDLESEG